MARPDITFSRRVELKHCGYYDVAKLYDDEDCAFMEYKVN